MKKFLCAALAALALAASTPVTAQAETRVEGRISCDRSGCRGELGLSWRK